MKLKTRKKDTAFSIKYWNLKVKNKTPNIICGALRDLVPFVQFKKREKHPWRSVNFSKVAGAMYHIWKIQRNYGLCSQGANKFFLLSE